MNYKGKEETGQAASANAGAGFLIRNGRTKEEAYLKSIRKERKTSWMESPVGQQEVPDSKKARRRGEIEPEDEAPQLCAVATWTMDEEQAMYFGSRAEAEKMIQKWPVLQHARAEVIQG